MKNCRYNPTATARSEVFCIPVNAASSVVFHQTRTRVFVGAGGGGGGIGFAFAVIRGFEWLLWSSLGYFSGGY
jgi:hypothetical protein